ncbi:DUF420 domain-containing protein [Caldithrix abyssi]
MSVNDLSTVNAVLNALSFVLLLIGYHHIRHGRQAKHKKWMVGALISSMFFLISYLIYHYHVGSIPYPHYDWTRPLYFILLVPHIILAAAMTPFIFYMVYRALQGRFELHKRVARVVFPVWVFVSISGVLIYVMLYLR